MQDLVGYWVLTPAAADENAPLKHRIEIRFGVAEYELYGAVLCETTEIPLREVSFDGTRLCFTLQHATATGFVPVSAMPYPIVLDAVTDQKFQGYWMKSDTEK